MGRETGHLQLLASLLLTGGKGANLVICGNVVLNTNDVGWLSCLGSVGGPRRNICARGPVATPSIGPFSTRASERERRRKAAREASANPASFSSSPSPPPSPGHGGTQAGIDRFDWPWSPVAPGGRMGGPDWARVPTHGRAGRAEIHARAAVLSAQS
jgi:hypothetical protein